MMGINTLMKKFIPTYLYIKTHNITGLKYFGKTTKVNPYAYTGSGEYWLNHLKIHGNNISTEIIGFFENKETVGNSMGDSNNIRKSQSNLNRIIIRPTLRSNSKRKIP
jgi:hypothetical protein